MNVSYFQPLGTQHSSDDRDFGYSRQNDFDLELGHTKIGVESDSVAAISPLTQTCAKFPLGIILLQMSLWVGDEAAQVKSPHMRGRVRLQRSPALFPNYPLPLRKTKTK